MKKRIRMRYIHIHTFPASCHATPVRASTASAPSTPNIAHLPWISSHSLNLCNPNTSEYGWNGVGFTSGFSNLDTPITSPATFFAKFWSSESKSYCKYSAGFPNPNGSNPRSPIMVPSSHSGASAPGNQTGRSKSTVFLGAGGGDFFLGPPKPPNPNRAWILPEFLLGFMIRVPKKCDVADDAVVKNVVAMVFWDWVSQWEWVYVQSCGIWFI